MAPARKRGHEPSRSSWSEDSWWSDRKLSTLVLLWHPMLPASASEAQYMARLLAERAFDTTPGNILEEDLSPHHVPYPARDAGYVRVVTYAGSGRPWAWKMRLPHSNIFQGPLFVTVRTNDLTADHASRCQLLTREKVGGSSGKALPQPCPLLSAQMAIEVADDRRSEPKSMIFAQVRQSCRDAHARRTMSVVR